MVGPPAPSIRSLARGGHRRRVGGVRGIIQPENGVPLPRRDALAVHSEAEGDPMSGSTTPEQRAESLVAVGPKEPGGFWFIRLQEVVSPEVWLGPYENPSLARADADRIRQFVAAVLR